MADVVAAPPVQPPRYGLLVAVGATTEDGRWQDGYVFEPDACGSGGRGSLEQCLSTGTLPTSSAPEHIEGEPFGVYADDTCSALDQSRDRVARARRQLEAVQSFEIAEELWTGSLGLPQRSLTDSASDTVTDGPEDVVTALACLEQALGRCYKGRRGMVHVTAQAFTHLLAAQAVRFDGGIALTGTGNIVVADAGYDGSGPGGTPAAASQWAYATPMVQVLLSEVQVTPPDLDSPESWAGALDRRTNTLTVFAKRLATWKFDECCHLAAQIDIGVCPIGGAS
jgi:hypothetical protein